jgi:hypothetical protein
MKAISILKVTLSIFIFGTFAADCAGLAQMSYPNPPLTLVADSVPKTVKAAKTDGWIPCPGQCLKLATKGWHHQDAPGHPPSDIWMTWYFTNNQGKSYQAYNQHHIGHVICAYPDRAAVDTGICPVCNGTGWVRKDSKNK